MGWIWFSVCNEEFVENHAVKKCWTSYEDY